MTLLLGVVFLLCQEAMSARPNILLIMADDMDQNQKVSYPDIMPNLKKEMVDGGTYFLQHVGNQPVCGPSRTSFLLGRLPHNTGYLNNYDRYSFEAARVQGNNTIGHWLRQSGYYTAFLGKYINGLECEPNPNNTWTYWWNTCQTYDFYNSSYIDNSGKKFVDTWTHQTDRLGNKTIEQIDAANAKGQPFYIHLTPVAIHAGVCTKYPPFLWYEPQLAVGNSLTCPPMRLVGTFNGTNNPRLPNYNVSTNASPYLADISKWPAGLSQGQAEDDDVAFRRRLEQAVGLDEMVAGIFAHLRRTGLLDNTYVIFTSDNGYHLGEHGLFYGKAEPFETDVRLPLYIRGPNVPQGVIRHEPTHHVDVTHTIVELAGASATAPVDKLDGRSLVELLHPGHQDAAPWRHFTYSEFHDANNTWIMLRIINATHNLKVWEWCTGEKQAFKIVEDQHELTDIWETFSENEQHYYHKVLLSMHHCAGEQCNHLDTEYSDKPLTCYQSDGVPP